MKLNVDQLVVTEITIYLLNKVYSDFCLYPFSCLYFGISFGSLKEFEKKRAREIERELEKKEKIKLRKNVCLYFEKQRDIKETVRRRDIGE